MASLAERVLNCFCAVFPTRSREELLKASRQSIPEWDSLAGITLLTVLQQEFRIDIDLTELEHLDSVQSVLSLVAPGTIDSSESHAI